jgi:hypothetical protein
MKDDLFSTEVLNEVTNNMRELYKEVRDGKTELQAADSLANIAGKILKSEQLKLAREVFVDEKERRIPLLGRDGADRGRSLPSPAAGTARAG